MIGSDNLDNLFVGTALVFQLVLIVHFSLRKWAFEAYTMKYGWIVYALSVPAVIVSLLLLVGGKSLSLWLGGYLYLLWAIYGYTIEYIRKIQWRDPMRWSIGGPYVILYLATVMFYWWPTALISKPLWVVCAVLFIVSTVLNVTSHKAPIEGKQPI